MHYSTVMKWIGLLAIASLLSSGVASADGNMGYVGWGLRGGLSVDPDQFFVGAQVDLGEFTENVHFKPNLTVGFGDDVMLLSINPDISYHFPVEDVGALYVGGILALQWIDYDQKGRDTDSELGLHAIGGLELQNSPIFLELNVGLDDTPDLKAAVGFTFPAD
jgi:hypothetical protein